MFNMENRYAHHLFIDEYNDVIVHSFQDKSFDFLGTAVDADMLVPEPQEQIVKVIRSYIPSGTAVGAAGIRFAEALHMPAVYVYDALVCLHDQVVMMNIKKLSFDRIRTRAVNSYSSSNCICQISHFVITPLD